MARLRPRRAYLKIRPKSADLRTSSNLCVLIAQNLLLTGVTSSLNLREIPSAPTYSSLYFYSKFDLGV